MGWRQRQHFLAHRWGDESDMSNLKKDKARMEKKVTDTLNNDENLYD